MANYTEGKWEVQQLGDGMWEILSGDYIIAQSGCPETIKEKNESMENALLIASAPALYKALKAWQDWEYGKTDKTFSMIQEMRMDALALVEGKEE